MLTIVVDPLVEQIGDAQLPDLWVHAQPSHGRRFERGHETDARGAFGEELGHDALRVALVVPTRGRHGGLVPGLEAWAVSTQDGADTSHEPPSIRLDEVTHDLVGTPLARSWRDSRPFAEGAHLADGSVSGSPYEGHDAGQREGRRSIHTAMVRLRPDSLTGTAV